MVESQRIIKFNKEIIPKLKVLSEKLIDQSRNHLLQICLISGVISAFLLPLYISKDFSLIQHLFIVLSLVCFLLSILVGMLYISYKLTKEQRNVLEMMDIIEKEDKEKAANFHKEHDKSLSWRKSIDIKSSLADILFAGGIIFLIVTIFLNETRLFCFMK